MSEQELEVHGKFGLPEMFGLTAAVEARYKRSWGRRSDEVMDVVRSQAGITPEELNERLEEDERARDIFVRGGTRALEASDPVYRAVLSRIIAAALDDAKVDEAEYLLAQLIKLEPIHVRALVASFDYWQKRDAEDPSDRWAPSPPHEATNAQKSRITTAALADQLQVAPALAAATIDALRSTGFLEEVVEIRRSMGRTLAETSRERQVVPGAWRPTEWGKSALSTIFPGLQIR